MGCSDCNDCQGLAKSYPAGPAGPPGADGAPGAPGAPGTPGADGTNGAGYDTEFCASNEGGEGSGMGSGIGNYGILAAYSKTITTDGNYDLFFNCELSLIDKQASGGTMGSAGLEFFIDDGGGPVPIAESTREFSYDDCYAGDICDSSIQWTANLLGCTVDLSVGDIVGVRAYGVNATVLRGTALYKLNNLGTGTFNILNPNKDGAYVPDPGPSWDAGSFTNVNQSPPARVTTGDIQFWFDRVTCALPMTITLSHDAATYPNIVNVHFGNSGTNVFVADANWSLVAVDGPSALQVVQGPETFDFSITYESCGTTKIQTGPFEIT